MKSMFDKTAIFLTFYTFVGSNFISMHDSNGCNGLYAAQHSNTPLLHYSCPLEVSL